jgi:tetratricopeptide (TPR) repeat protein
MANNMRPEDIRRAADQASSLPPEAFTAAAAAGVGPAAAASAAPSPLSAQQKYMLHASKGLKAEGNKLHGSGQYAAAAEKYQRAISNVATHVDPESVQLRISCQSNLASCHLQLGQWQSCIDQCQAVLHSDRQNRKAFYRRGQAHSALQQHDAAVADLAQALALSPDAEKALIRDKLQEAKEKQRLASRGARTMSL